MRQVLMCGEAPESIIFGASPSLVAGGQPVIDPKEKAELLMAY